jgi:2-polyprenyl-3-methyl-5-hydroxy-6-metoxy-1,4-benzoquinol methylase
MSDLFGACEICGGRDWAERYRGPVRDGPFGFSVEGGVVARCERCGAERLAEKFCPPENIYQSDAYRKKLRQELDTKSYFAEHDHLQVHTLRALAEHPLQGLTIADVGCAGGSFLNQVNESAKRVIAIEPSPIYHQSLAERKFAVFPFAANAARSCAGTVDLAVSLQVIEHTVNPRDFLAETRPLIGPHGSLLISTPNRNDILLELLPQDFAAFFYRVVHRWYFDADSLAECARRAGYRVTETRFVHRYGLSNALAWLRDRRPTGTARLSGIEPAADVLWRDYLEMEGRSDCLYMFLELEGGPKA